MGVGNNELPEDADRLDVDAWERDLNEDPELGTFTPEQRAYLDERIAQAQEAEPEGVFARRRERGHHRTQRRRKALRSFVEAGMPSDEQSDFDQATFTGRAAAKLSASRWWMLLLIGVLVVVVAGWFYIVYSRPPLVVTVPVVAGVVGLPVWVFSFLGRKHSS